MTRKYTKKIMKIIREETGMDYAILVELLLWLPEDTVKEFFNTSFGNMGIQNWYEGLE